MGISPSVVLRIKVLRFGVDDLLRPTEFATIFGAAGGDTGDIAPSVLPDLGLFDGAVYSDGDCRVNGEVAGSSEEVAVVVVIRGCTAGIKST